MNDQSAAVYCLNQENGGLREADCSASGRGTGYLVIPRAHLHFFHVTLSGHSRLRQPQLLNLQKSLAPVKKNVQSFIYTSETRTRKDACFWINNREPYADTAGREEIPETLFFKGSPADIGKYGFFVFRRAGGVEIVFLEYPELFSFFCSTEADVSDRILQISRKFSLRNVRILSEIPLTVPRKSWGIEILPPGSGGYFLPDYVDFTMKHSDFASARQCLKMKNLRYLWNRVLLLALILVSMALILNAVGAMRALQKKKHLNEGYARVSKLMEQTDRLEFTVNQLKEQAQAFPHHFPYWERIINALGPTAVLSEFSYTENRYFLKGYCADSLGLLKKLRRSGLFSAVKLKNNVTRNIRNKTERFEIELTIRTEKK